MRGPAAVMQKDGGAKRGSCQGASELGLREAASPDTEQSLGQGPLPGRLGTRPEADARRGQSPTPQPCGASHH